MLYIFGKQLPVTKKIINSLVNIFGINFYQSKKICRKIGFNPSVRIKSLKKVQINKLIKYIDKNLLIEQDLKKKKIQNKKNLINIKTVRGLRNLKGLPVRGQRTHTNSKTCKKLKNKI